MEYRLITLAMPRVDLKIIVTLEELERSIDRGLLRGEDTQIEGVLKGDNVRTNIWVRYGSVAYITVQPVSHSEDEWLERAYTLTPLGELTLD